MANDDGEGIEALLRQIAPRDDGPDAFTFASATRGHRQFGGITIAQAFVAAAQTVAQVRPHALHILFLRPHMPDAPVRYAVNGCAMVAASQRGGCNPGKTAAC